MGRKVQDKMATPGGVFIPYSSLLMIAHDVPMPHVALQQKCLGPSPLLCFLKEVVRRDVRYHGAGQVAPRLPIDRTRQWHQSGAMPVWAVRGPYLAQQQ
jgi:hypothetical protein